MKRETGNHYLHLIRRDCPLPPGTHYEPVCICMDLMRFSPNIGSLSNLPSNFSKQLFSPKA
jgi:hypothetical protein